MSGQAIDIRCPTCRWRSCNAALALQRGGVGFCRAPDFVHVDTRRVRRLVSCPQRRRREPPFERRIVAMQVVGEMQQPVVDTAWSGKYSSTGTGALRFTCCVRVPSSWLRSPGASQAGWSFQQPQRQRRRIGDARSRG